MYNCKLYEKCIITKYTRQVYTISKLYYIPETRDIDIDTDIPATKIRTVLANLGYTADDGFIHTFEIYLNRIQTISYVTIKYIENSESSIMLSTLSDNILYGKFCFWTLKYFTRFPQIVGFRS